MKFGAITFIWTSPFTTAELSVLGRVARAGYDVVEVAVEEAGALDPDLLRAALDEHGLDVIVIGFGTAGRDLSSGDAAERTAGLQYGRACVDLAAGAGARVLCGPLHSAVGKARVLDPGERRAERARAVEGLREVAGYAGERGISVALEPLNRFENDMLNTVAQGLELCDAVGLENVGLLLDTFHMNVEEKHMGGALREAGERLLHFHASENDRGAPGSGHVNWHEVRDGLQAIGYDEVVSVESFVPTVPGLQTAVSMWRPFFEDPDRFALESLTHLHSMFA
jgi:D-psicose/D-tagatose/L-ribulose 3-epimerase